MGQPAARLGDMTMHGGAIVVGCPTVLIGGMPAARAGDMHVCPMLNPGLPPPPHVGGPVALGSPMVLIGGMPAARMGDMLVCAGPPDTIALGCMTVLIGEGGSGSASAGGGGSAGAGAAAAGAAAAQSGAGESATKLGQWVEFAFTDAAGLPVSGIEYAIITPDGARAHGVLQGDGRVMRDALPGGGCSVELLGVSGAAWSKDRANAGEKVKWSARVDGHGDGTTARWAIFRRDLTGPDSQVLDGESKVRAGRVEGEWAYEAGRSVPAARTGDAGASSAGTAGTERYSAPEYYVEVAVGNSRSRSGLLAFRATAEVGLLDHRGKPMGGVKYRIRAANGEIREGTLDGNGKAKLDNLVPGRLSVKFDKRSARKQLSRRP